MAGDYLTGHYDNARTGWNTLETVLTVATVRHGFRLLFTQPVDGQIYAQPLVVAGVDIPGKGTHDVAYVATEGDSVYAFAAHANVPALWHRRLVPPGEEVVLSSDVGNCGNIQPQIGITGTPVIDRAANTLYVVAKTRAGTHIHQRLHALDITTGADKHGSPVEVQATVPGNAAGHDGAGHIPFDPRWHLNRAGLLLSHGSLYLSFGSHCDFGPYHGWIIRYDAATLRQLGAFNASPEVSTGPPPGSPRGFTDRGSAIWQSGGGPAADPAGDIYVMTGNGPFDAYKGGRDYGDSVLKLRADLTVADYFTPSDQARLNSLDLDLGSGGPMLLPPEPDAHPALLVACGKEGTIYLIDRQNMGRYKTGAGGSDRVLQRLPGAVGGIWGSPAYYRGPGGQFVFYCGTSPNDHLRAFKLSGGRLALSSQSPDSFASHSGHEGGAIPAVSSNGYAAGTGVVWTVRRTNPLTLFAHDAADVAVKLFEGDAGPWNNPGGGPFMTPTVSHGKVFVGTADRLAVFGH